MNRRALGLSALLLCVLNSAVCAQSIRKLDATARFSTLTTDIPQAAATDAVREIRFTWTAAGATLSPATAAGAQQRFSFVDQRLARGPLPRERRPELSADQLVIVVLGADDAVLDWRLVRNPRRVRAEFPGPDGVLSGGALDLPGAEVSVTIADVPGMRKLRVYQPRWTGAEFMLDAAGELDLPQ